jgi:hypothetical protein
MRRVYISGKMGGNVNEAIRKKFAEAEELFVHNGYEVVNPAGEAHQEQVCLAVMIAKDKWPNEQVKDYTVALAFDIHTLAMCDAIYMLRDWRWSAGAKAELAFAKATGMEIIYEEDMI